MKNKLCFLVLLVIITISMAGCNEMDEILGKVNQILGQQLATDEDENIDSEMESNELKEEEAAPVSSEAETEGGQESDGHENEAGQVPSFEERFIQAGYSPMDPPNGLPLPILEDWILVEEKQKDSFPWEGVFCFDTDMDETIVEVEESIMDYELDTKMVQGMSIEDGDRVHTTTFEFGDEYEIWQGDMVYFADDYGTSCTKLSIEYAE